LTLDKILDIQKWQNLQDSLAEVTKLAIITVDYKGVPITRHSSPRLFCQYLRSQPDLEKMCHKCDSRGGLEAVRINAPYIYLCHCNIVDLAIPIIIDGKYIGATLAGEIRLPESKQGAQLERILLSPTRHIFRSKELVQMYKEIPFLSFHEIQNVAKMLFDLCGYIVEEAMNKNLILEMYEKMATIGEVEKPKVAAASGYSLDNIAQVKKAMGNVITSAYIKTTGANPSVCKNPVLRPAINYIFENKGENITQIQMAQLCHISTSHFSRLFAKEVGEGFSSFVSRLKVEWSKQLLEKTDLPVTQISDELGFSEPGYYIKTFKKFEKVTPATYRKYYAESSN